MDIVYSTITQDGKTVRVRTEWIEVLADVLLDSKGCNSWLRGGRGALMRFDYPRGKGLVRPYRRGGLIGKFVKSGYVLSNRPRRELEIHTYLFENGFSIPEPLGAMWERNGLIYRGALATHEVAASNLLDHLDAYPQHGRKVLDAAGKLIREMHDLGVYHADLQVANILVGQKRVYIIDFDKARRFSKVSRLRRARNLLRLRRSMSKHGMPDAFFAVVCHGYGVEALPGWLDKLYHVKGALSDAMTHKDHD